MKKLLLFFISLLIVTNIVSQNSIYNEHRKIHQDYGTFILHYENNIISVSGYVTIEEIDSEAFYDKKFQTNSTIVKKNWVNEIGSTGSKKNKKYYHYDLYLVSKSIFNGKPTNTWLYGTKILIDSVNVLVDQFPDGFIVSIGVNPTKIYSYNSDKPDIKFEINWAKSVYETKTPKNN